MNGLYFKKREVERAALCGGPLSVIQRNGWLLAPKGTGLRQRNRAIKMLRHRLAGYEPAEEQRR